MITIQGNTRPHAAMLRAQGCVWDAIGRYWIAPSVEIATKITSPSWGRRSAKDLRVVTVQGDRPARIDAICNEGGEGYGSPRNEGNYRDRTPYYKGNDQSE